MSRWFSSTAAGPAPVEAASAPDPSLREALRRLAAREGTMLEGQVNFLTPELLQVDGLVREAAGTLEEALKTLSQSVQHQHLLVREVQANMSNSLEGEEAGGADHASSSIMGTVDGLLNHIMSVSDSTAQVVDQINDISERSQRMEGMLEELAEIAGRTHLLSLNASIEAAHARQFGAGFAVVAGEVSKLADRSTALSTNIQSQVHGTKAALELANAHMKDVASKDMDVARQSKLDSEALIMSIQTTNWIVKDLVGQMEENAKKITDQVGHVVRSLQFEDLVHQTLMACLKELGNLLEQASAWKQLESKLADGEPEAAALAFLEARLLEIEAARVQFRAVKSGSLTAGEVDLF